MGIWPFQRSRADEDAEKLLEAVNQASRRADFFGENKTPDTLDGRFEMLTLHAALALIRLQAAPEAAPLAQSFTDKLFRSIDAGLREAGVSDTSVPKRMHKLAASFYGRLDAYAAGLADRAAFETALARNVWRAEAHPYAGALAAYAQRVAEAQREAPVAALLEITGWPA